MAKVVSCVPYGKDEDIGRWMRDIVDPVVAAARDVRLRERRGTTHRRREEKGRKGMARAVNRLAHSAAKRRRRTVLEDSSSSDEDGDNGGDIADAMEIYEKVMGKIGEEEMGNHFLLIDTDDDDEDNEDNDVKDFATPRKRPTPVGDGNSGRVMSKRNNMDYRVAGKKREG